MLRKTLLLSLFACFFMATSYGQTIYIANQTCSAMDVEMKLGTQTPCNSITPYINTIPANTIIGPIPVPPGQFVLAAGICATGTTNCTSVTTPSCGGIPNGNLGPLLCDPNIHPVSLLQFGTTQVVLIQ